MALRTRERQHTDDPRVFVDYVVCALKEMPDRSLFVRGHADEPLLVQGSTLLRCRILINCEFTGMDAKVLRGFEYRARNTEEGRMSPDAAYQFLRDNCREIAHRLESVDPADYELDSSIRASFLGKGIFVSY